MSEKEIQLIVDAIQATGDIKKAVDKVPRHPQRDPFIPNALQAMIINSLNLINENIKKQNNILRSIKDGD